MTSSKPKYPKQLEAQAAKRNKRQLPPYLMTSMLKMMNLQRNRITPMIRNPQEINVSDLLKYNCYLELEQEFEEGFEELVTKVKIYGEKTLGLKDAKQKLQFIDFLRRFKQIYRKEFFADNLTSILLRQLYVS